MLLTGPTGCGKSTTLYSFLKEINKPTVNIVTVEDPVEYTMPGHQPGSGEHKGHLTFASALRSILRQDPDVIMVGEIRDEDTAEIAVRAAITGHLVFSTLHTNDAPGAVIRLEDMKVTDYLVAGRGGRGHRAKACQAPLSCLQKARQNKRGGNENSRAQRACLHFPSAGLPVLQQYGVKGRIAVHEIMYMSDAVKSAVIRGVPLEDLRKLAEENGMVNLWDSGKSLVLKGITDVSELMTLFDD